MKKCIKLVVIIIMLLSVTFIFPNHIFADWNYKTEITESTWANKQAANNGGSQVIKTTRNVMGIAIQIIRIVGTGIAIIMITYVAIKYMSAAPNEKAEFKKSATAYIVGAIVLFASTNIISIIANFATTAI